MMRGGTKLISAPISWVAIPRPTRCVCSHKVRKFTGLYLLRTANNPRPLAEISPSSIPLPYVRPRCSGI
ncbi:hypothetical protein LMH87_009838 [Akanthomyces muscarius]|uniref:Uncharacterized protein n=1 Tax=Akanthomyces muscarius TaxID=2231603 RepID=A0A9W8QC53_AKAMU|nr:hypothetical protein LMH87_009838 [Akanthomyces muscarius]KAJ4153348.1 hypothetical protein LMH87_009838 [Akanthomyces muscarius]